LENKTSKNFKDPACFINKKNIWSRFSRLFA